MWVLAISLAYLSREEGGILLVQRYSIYLPSLRIERGDQLPVV
jgi:hypothetical protein